MENSPQHSPRPQLHSFFGILVAILLVCLCAPMLYNRFVPRHWPSESRATLERIHEESPLAEASWKSYKITDYDIDVKVQGILCYDPRGDDIITSLHLKIRQSEIVFENDIQKTYVECYGISDFLPPKVFETIRPSIWTIDPKEDYLKIEFDPEYGFVSEYLYEPNNPRLSGRVRYIFSNFRRQKP